MARQLFGTDGIRGKANTYPMTAEMAMKLGIAAGSYFKKEGYRNKIVVSKDTRLSGYMIESAIVAGFTAVGMDVLITGPMPTPSVSMVVKSMRADLGVMISASHNPYFDNGIKLFGPDGFKLSDEAEEDIEKMMLGDVNQYLVESYDIGRAKRIDDVFGRYIMSVKSSLSDEVSLDGLKIVLDCANGAAYKVAPMVLEELGAEVVTIGVNPNGYNINKGCGATATDFMCEEVVKHQADLGLALDGDADRLIVCDENGKMIDGDQIIALIATQMKLENNLKDNTVVATIMSNMGMEKYLENNDMKLVRTKVGDRYVLEAMREHGYSVGGEQSGHIVLSDFASTGDGLLAALQVCKAVQYSPKFASELLNVFTPMPQKMINVRCKSRECLVKILEDKKVVKSIEKNEKFLKSDGRVVIRKSGTEPVVRVMAEGIDVKKVEKVVESIAKEIELVNASM